jgi:hypothetical protein
VREIFYSCDQNAPERVVLGRLACGRFGGEQVNAPMPPAMCSRPVAVIETGRR